MSLALAHLGPDRMMLRRMRSLWLVVLVLTVASCRDTLVVPTRRGITTLPNQKVGKPTRVNKPSVVSVQLVLTKHGRVLMVKVRSLKKSAKLQIRLVNAKGKVIATVVRTVKTNKRVAVKNLKIAKSVKHVRVKIVG